MKNLRDALREYTKRLVIRRQPLPVKSETKEIVNPLDAPRNTLNIRMESNILANNAASLRKELSKRSNNDSFWALHRDMSENEAASMNLFYQFYINHRYKNWTLQETWYHFDAYVERISVMKEPRIRGKAKEIIKYSNMAHQAYRGV